MSSDLALYTLDADGRTQIAAEEQIIAAALARLDARVRERDVLDSPAAAKRYACVRLGALEHEVFAVMMLDTHHRLIAWRELFRGTLTQTSVDPREVVKEALALNAAAVLLVHNHPSGVGEPSRADEALTQLLKQALALVDVRVVDHLVVAGGVAISFAERGLL
jgi:DNA repair protein RadC